MNAIIRTGGKQYKVKQGDQILIEKIPGEVGADVKFDEVLLIDGEKTVVGTPYVSGASVKGKIVSQGKGKKVIAFMYRKRKGYHRKKGHRQELTRVEINQIQG